MSTARQRAGIWSAELVVGQEEVTLAVVGRGALWLRYAVSLLAAAVCVAALAHATLPALSSSSKPIIPRADLQHRNTPLPSSPAAVASAGIGASQPRFWPVRHGGSLVAGGGGIHSTFTAAGARLRVASGTLGLFPLRSAMDSGSSP